MSLFDWNLVLFPLLLHTIRLQIKRDQCYISSLQEQHTLGLFQNTMQIPTQKPNTIKLEENTRRE
jgi:hypothetical protein